MFLKSSLTANELKCAHLPEYVNCDVSKADSKNFSPEVIILQYFNLTPCNGMINIFKTKILKYTFGYVTDGKLLQGIYSKKMSTKIAISDYSLK